MASAGLFCLVFVFATLVVTFSQEVDLRYNLLEEQPIGTEVANISTDSRAMINITDEVFNQLRYQLLTEGYIHAKSFTINEQTGRLTTAAVIDREKVCQVLPTCDLGLLLAIFQDDPRYPNNPDLIKYLRVDVTLLDINDHPPVFPESEVTVSISEKVSVGYVVPIDAATDEDSGTNNSVHTYELLTVQNVFRLVQTDTNNQLTLEIEVNNVLDYEDEKYYRLEILAKDNGSPQKSGSVTVHVNILDENDNPPLFTETLYSASTVENRDEGVVLLQVKATDADSGDNGRVSYSFSPSSAPSLFGINETTGEIFVNGQIDYETDQSFSFYVQAMDHAIQPRVTSVLVNIAVTDVNDNAPQVNINLPPGGNIISEAAQPGRYIANVAVSDPDSGVFGNVTCQLLSDFFKMEILYSNMYKVTLQRSLDRETRAYHNVSVHCADGGSPKLETTTSFLISVGDVNDNPPTFTEAIYNVSIYENNDIGDPVTIVTAADGDEAENGRVTYSLYDDVENLFSINPDSGVVSTNVIFDRETLSKLQFRVVAKDNSAVTQYSSTAMVVVNILDKNDNKPSFSQEVYSFSVAENQAPGTVIGRVFVSDKDAGDNGNIHFPQTHPYSSIFEIIQSTGQIQTKIVLDREAMDIYNFYITASDNGEPSLQTTASLVIIVEDKNDNVPNVTFPSSANNTVSITPGKSEGALVTKVTAFDIDEGANSRLFYSLVKGDTHRLFRIDNQTGVVTLAKYLLEDYIGTYTLLLAVQDGGTPSHTSWPNLVVVVDNEEANKNVVIVIAIVSVTVTISVVLIITICLIRRQDSTKQRSDQKHFTEHKKKFIHEWLHCLSTSTKDVHKLGVDKSDAQMNRLNDLKPIYISSKASTASETSQDGAKHGSKETIERTDDDEGFVETSGGTLSHDSGRGDSVRTRHDSTMSQQELLTSQESSRLYHSLPRFPVGNGDTESDPQCSTVPSDSLSIPESWQSRPLALRPGYNRNISLDEQMLRDRQNGRTPSSFREDSRFSLKDSVISKNNNIHQELLGLSYDSHSLQRQMQGNYSHPQGNYPHTRHLNGSSTVMAQKRTLSPISATPEPSDAGLSSRSNSSSYMSHPRSPTGHSSYQGIHFFGSQSMSDNQSPRSQGTTLRSYATDAIQLESCIDTAMNSEDCIV